jgi:DNA-binding MarR family transcriptional regulator
VSTLNLVDECAEAVLETLPQVMRAIHEEMRRQGNPLLSPPQLRTLAYLHRSPESCLFHVADHLGVTHPTASVIVERLVRRGLVARITNPQERRRIMLKLTPEGAWHLQRARQATQTWLVGTLSQLSTTSLRRIKQGVALLGEPFAGAASGDVHRPATRPRSRGSQQPPGSIPAATSPNARVGTGRGNRAGLSGQ